MTKLSTIAINSGNRTPFTSFWPKGLEFDDAFTLLNEENYKEVAKRMSSIDGEENKVLEFRFECLFETMLQVLKELNREEGK